MNKYLYNFESLQKKRKLLFYRKHTDDLIMFIFLDFKHNGFTLSQICHTFFLRMEFQQEQMFFLHSNALYMG